MTSEIQMSETIQFQHSSCLAEEPFQRGLVSKVMKLATVTSLFKINRLLC